jgi:hypothetical protein
MHSRRLFALLPNKVSLLRIFERIIRIEHIIYKFYKLSMHSCRLFALLPNKVRLLRIFEWIICIFMDIQLIHSKLKRKLNVISSRLNRFGEVLFNISISKSIKYLHLLTHTTKYIEWGKNL